MLRICTAVLREFGASVFHGGDHFKFTDLVSKLIAEEVCQSESARIEAATALYTSKKNGTQYNKEQ